MARRACWTILGVLFFSVIVFPHAARANVVYDNSREHHQFQRPDLPRYGRLQQQPGARRLRHFATLGDTPPTVSSVTYAGVALTQIVHQIESGWKNLWRPLGPARGHPARDRHELCRHHAERSGEPGQTIHSGAISAYNVDQSTTFTRPAATPAPARRRPLPCPPAARTIW